jgi:hypothetical protein
MSMLPRTLAAKENSRIYCVAHAISIGAARQNGPKERHRASLEPSRPVTGLVENGKLARTDP